MTTRSLSFLASVQSSDLLGPASGHKPARPDQAISLAWNGSWPRLGFCEALGHGSGHGFGRYFGGFLQGVNSLDYCQNYAVLTYLKV